MGKITMGVIGLGLRGTALIETVSAIKEAEITYVCDVYEDRIKCAQDKIETLTGKRPKGCVDYLEILQDERIRTVLICTPWDLHVKMAIDSMRMGKITAMEVGGASDIEDCSELVRTYEETKTPFMMLENCCFDRFELLTTAIVRAGLLGEVVHCHGAYCHDLRSEILGGRVNRHYRLEQYKRRNCDNYPTHELGPIAKLLNINHGNRIVSLVSVASKAVGLEAFSLTKDNPDQTQIGTHFRQGDIISTILTCAGGQTITLSLDTTLPKYYSREFTVRGTKGMCVQEANMVLLEDCVNMHEFFAPQDMLRRHMDNVNLYQDFIVDEWKSITDEQRKLGHGGMDYIMFRAFFDAVMQNREMPIDVYDAACWMAVSALSQKSIENGGAPCAFPDFTNGKWTTSQNKDVLALPVIQQKTS